MEAMDRWMWNYSLFRWIFLYENFVLTGLMMAWERVETCSTHVEAQLQLTGVVFHVVIVKVKVKVKVKIKVKVKVKIKVKVKVKVR